MPDTATRNIDSVIDGQIYIGKCVFFNRRHFVRKFSRRFSLIHTLPTLQSRRRQVHRPPTTIWHYAPRVRLPGLSS